FGQNQRPAGVRFPSKNLLRLFHLPTSFFRPSSFAQSLSEIDVGFGETWVQARGFAQFTDGAAQIVHLEKRCPQIIPDLSVVGAVGYGGAQFYDRRRKLSFLTKREAQRAAGQRESGILFERFAKLFFGGRQIVFLFERYP